MTRVKIIAEIGVNHNGSMALAKELIDSAKQCGADLAKFQTFAAERLAAPDTPKVPYQLRTSDAKETHFEMLKSLEFKREDHRPIIDYCAQQGIEFCSTPYGLEDAQFLAELGVSTFKVASADIIDRPMHEFLAKTGKTCIIAAGMATLGEIEETLNIYRDGGTFDKVVLLQCTSAYPTDPADVNLRAMLTFREAFKCRVGLSDHTADHFTAVAAAALGAEVIEKHFTLDRSLPGPDHAASVTPDEMAMLVKGVRTVELALGDGVKTVLPAEREMHKISRKSLIAASDLGSGHVLAENDITSRRPGTGLSPMRHRDIIGKRLIKGLKAGEQIRLENLSS